MSKKNLLILSLVTMVILTAAVITNQSRAPQSGIERQKLFPDLATRIDDIAVIEIQSGKDSVHISREGDTWVVQEAHNYPARFEKVRQLVLGTVELYVLAERTGNPSLYAELGVEDPQQQDASSHLLTFNTADGTVLTSLIVGHDRKSSAPGGTQGLYVRKPDAGKALLAEGTLDVSADPKDWIDKNLLNVANHRISRTVIEYPDGSTLSLVREQGEEDFTIVNIPEGKAPESSFILNNMGTFLSNLTIDDVRPADEFPLPEPHTRTTLGTYDGLVAHITSARTEDANYATLAFSVDEDLIRQDEAADSGESEEKPAGDDIDVRQEAADLNDTVAGWVFVIPDYKYRALVRQPDELLQDTESAES